jgi:hypothetical protein
MDSAIPWRSRGNGGIRWDAPFTVAFQADLRSSRRKLYSGGLIGQEVHAASSLRQRHIVFDSALLSSPAELRRIATHELFHFAWIRLGNPGREAWEALLERECAARARGELGWSAEWRKLELTKPDWRNRSRRWRDYVCESFCDTAAWLLTGAHPHAEVTLGTAHARRRADWFVRLLRTRGVTI